VPDRNGNPDTQIVLEDLGGDLIEPSQFAVVRGIVGVQLRAVCEWAYCTPDLADAANQCADDDKAWLRYVYRHAREPERTWDAWWTCFEDEGAHFTESGLVLLGGTTEMTGIEMWHGALQYLGHDPEIAALYQALLRVA
jgi:hypothetical protein